MFFLWKVTVTSPNLHSLCYSDTFGKPWGAILMKALEVGDGGNMAGTWREHGWFWQPRHVTSEKVGPYKRRFFAGIQASWQLATGPAGFKTFICPTPPQPPLQVHLFSLHTHTPLLTLHPDTRREGQSISNPTTNPPHKPNPILPA